MKTWKYAGRTAAALVTAMILPLLFSPAAMAAGTTGVEDGADILTDSEEEEILGQLQDLTDETGYDFFAVTTDDAGGLSSEEYADDYYLDHSDQDDGAVFLIDMDNRYYYISTSGIMIRYITDSRLDTILDDAQEEMQDGEYASAFETMIGDTADYIRQGIPSGQYNIDRDTGEISPYHSPNSVNMVELIIALVAGIATALIFAGTTIARYGMKSGTYHYDYRKNSKVNLSRREDLFVNRLVTRRHIDREPHGGGGGGGGGHSSTTHSSGGHSFGGGGRGF